MAGFTTTYKLPWPELSNPANASSDFQKLATAVEAQAFPQFQSQVSGRTDAYTPVGTGKSAVLYDVPIASAGIVGWVDIDADVMVTCPPNIAVGGGLTILVNGAVIREVLWHSWWRVNLLCAYNSVRVPNLNGVAMRMQVVFSCHATSQPAAVTCANWSAQVYGKKLTV